jgi:ubiquinone biosynthesis O-methyltransferase
MVKQSIEFVKYKKKGSYHWTQISRHYYKRNVYVLARYLNMVKLVKKTTKDRVKDKRILDVGCGDGVLAYFLSRTGASVSGIDGSVEAVSYAKEKNQNREIDFQVASAYDLPFADNHFDLVVSSEVIEHIDDVAAYLQEIKRVLKPGGSIIISTPVRYTEKPLDQMHVTEWFPEEYQAMIERHLPGSTYFQSHPLVWQELYELSAKSRIIINFISWFKNPFVGFNSRFKHHSLQYSISTKK